MFNIPLVNQQLQQTSNPSPSKALLFYASAHWCPPCRQFTPLLKMFYELAKASRCELEIVFLSSDRSERDMVSYFQESHGSWLAVPFFSDQRQFLSNHFNIRGIPSLILLNRGTLQPVNLDVRSVVQQLAMSGSSERVKAVVNEWGTRSGSILFEAIPRSMSLLNKEQRSSVFELLAKLISNIANHPTESKYRQLKSDNAAIRKAILDLPCGAGPLVSIGFEPDRAGNFSFTPSLMDPATAELVLKNRESNGLSDMATTAPVQIGTTAPKIAPVISSTLSQSLQAKLCIHYRNCNPVKTDDLPFESLEILQALVESVTDVSSENQRLFAPSIVKEGPINGTVSEGLIANGFNVAATASKNGYIDILLMGQHTNTHPTVVRYEDTASNMQASNLRTRILSLKQSSIPSQTMNSIFSTAIHVQIYEVPSNQVKALEVMPIMDLHRRALSTMKGSPDSNLVYEEVLFRELLSWFKAEFFKWMNQPRCSQCSATSTKLANTTSPPTEQEMKGLANHVEVYMCEVCEGLTRFPRFNHPVALLVTRTGRCGEWANCFALLARSLGFEIRKVNDSADHVWVEVWMEHRGEWVHCDPCENAYDKPLLYEQGWAKQTSFTVAVGRDCVQDVTRRYSLKARTPEFVSANENILTPMKALSDLLMTNSANSNPELLETLKSRYLKEQDQLNQLPAKGALVDKELGGRTTGSVEWREARGEMGNSAHSFSIGTVEIKVSAIHGGRHGDTVPFSDENVLREITSIPNISQISLWDDGRIVAGIEWSGTAGSASHLGKIAVGRVSPTACLTLESGEFIAKVSVRVGDLVDYIHITTSKGKNISAGNPSGGSPVVDPAFDLDGRHQVIGFVGGLGGHLHSIGLIVAPPKAEVAKGKFNQLVAGGMSPNEAAIEILKYL